MTTIKLSHRDIVKGERRNCGACPIALSVNRRLKPGFHCEIENTYGYVYNRKRVKHFKLPLNAVAFIQDFDSQEVDVEPFQFEVDIPNEYLRLN